MKLDWRAIKQSAMPPSDGFGDPDVLVEYNGPQLVLYTKHDAPRYLALAADWDTDAVRWLFADTSPLEVEALALGNVAMRDVFVLRRELMVVDFDRSGSPTNTWPIAPSAVPKGILPAPGAPLPDFVQDHLTESMRVLRLRL